jgi:large conductance mechanosensitive channel
MLKEFKEFVMKGSVVDLAVAVIIGAAFKAIISSLVNDILMPIISILMGGISFTDLKYVITPASGDLAEVAILYGSFIQSIVDFVIIAFTIFLIIKIITKKKREEEAAPTAPPEPSKEEVLLTDIRDILKNSN